MLRRLIDGLVLMAALVLTPVVLFLSVVGIRYRVGYLIRDRIGHYIFDVEWYLTVDKIDREIPALGRDILFLEGVSCNAFLDRMVKRQVPVRLLARPLHRATEFIPAKFSQVLAPARERNGSRDPMGRMGSQQTALRFTATENLDGQQALVEFGLPPKQRFVCLMVRDGAYLEKRIRGWPGRWDYHSYRDSPIEDYKDCVSRLLTLGYFVIRMGQVVERRLAIDDPRVIDYPFSKYKSDFLDIWLPARCTFGISTGTGLDAVSLVFQRPIVYVNFLPLVDNLSWSENIFVPKYLRWKKNGRLLSVKEYVSYSLNSSHRYVEEGIEVNNLQPHEITAAANEMHHRLCNNWKVDPLDEENQSRFWGEADLTEKCPKAHNFINPEARIGAQFLRDNATEFFSR